MSNFTGERYEVSNVCISRLVFHTMMKFGINVLYAVYYTKMHENPFKNHSMYVIFHLPTSTLEACGV